MKQTIPRQLAKVLTGCKTIHTILLSGMIQQVCNSLEDFSSIDLGSATLAFSHNNNELAVLNEDINNLVYTGKVNTDFFVPVSYLEYQNQLLDCDKLRSNLRWN